MIKLEIKVQPKQIKQLEFSQTLNLITKDLTHLCNSLFIKETNGVFILIAEMNTREQLKQILHSRELNILSGAIVTLCKKSNIIIKGMGHIRRGSDIREIRVRL